MWVYMLLSPTNTNIINPSQVTLQVPMKRCARWKFRRLQNPGDKGAFVDVTSKIRDLCVRFSNQQANCKTHLKKPPPKAKGGAKRGARPKAKDEGDDE